MKKRIRRIAIYALVLAPYASVMFWIYHSRPDLSYWILVLAVILIELLVYNELYGEEPLYRQRRIQQ